VGIASELFQITNSIKDNLWLGDISEIHKLINSLFEKINDEEIRRYIEASIKFRDHYRSLRKELKQEHKGLALFLNLSIKFNKRIQKLGINPRDSIIGANLEYIEKLKEKIRAVKEIIPVRRQEKYKYTLRRYKYGYEARAIIPDLRVVCTDKLKETLLKLKFQPWIIAETKSFLSSVAFSDNAYLEIVIFAPRMYIVLKILPEKVQNVERNIKSLIESQIS